MTTKIMIVDDEPAIGRMLQYQLREYGYTTSYIPDGLLALQRLEREQPDLILLDVMMPTISGWEICREIRSSSSIPIIMLTGKSSDQDVATGLGAGADDYIAKPFSMIQLQARVEAVLRRSNLNRRGAENSRVPVTGTAPAIQVDIPQLPTARYKQPSAAPQVSSQLRATTVAPRVLLDRTPEQPVVMPAPRPLPTEILRPRLGTQLREKRQAKGLSLHQIERFCRVRWDYLQALEQENFDYIPRAHMRLALTTYANYLGVELTQLLPKEQNQSWLGRQPVQFAAFAAVLMLLIVVGLYLF